MALHILKVTGAILLAIVVHAYEGAESSIIRNGNDPHIEDWAVPDFVKDKKRRPLLSETCNLYQGKWIYDKDYPLWNPNPRLGMERTKRLSFFCSFLGRTDNRYQKLRWQPDECDIPRFNASDFLRRMTNKTIHFVGDSFAKNTLESLVGLLSTASSPRLLREKTMGYYIRDANLSVIYFPSSSLVEEERMPKTAEHRFRRHLHADKLGLRWTSEVQQSDIVVVNGGHHFVQEELAPIGRIPHLGGVPHPNMTDLELFQRAMVLLGQWARSRRESGSKLFFLSYEPFHRWHRSELRAAAARYEAFLCFFSFLRFTDRPCGVPVPTLSPLAYPGPLREYGRTEAFRKIADTTLRPYSDDITFLNITELSVYRNDAHVAWDGSPRWDCLHWCLPGVPDTWNELIFSELLRREQLESRS